MSDAEQPAPSGGPRPGPCQLEVPEVPGAALAELPLSALRGYRRQLAAEEERVSYWRRLVHARIDLLQAGTSTHGPLTLAAVRRVLGETGTGRNRTALVRVRAEEPLPALPVLEEMWVHETDQDDPEAVASALQRLVAAEQQLTAYRRALHGRIDEATNELIDRYRTDPTRALAALRTDAGPSGVAP